LEKRLAGTGRNPAAAMTGMSDNKATSRGMGRVAADQSVDDAYTETLAALAATGRGERAAVGDSLSRQAGMSGPCRPSASPTLPQPRRMRSGCRRWTGQQRTCGRPSRRRPTPWFGRRAASAAAATAWCSPAAGWRRTPSSRAAGSFP
jgi:hypothetical protein